MQLALSPKTLVIDVDGTHVKLLATGKVSPVNIESGYDMTPWKMVMNGGIDLRPASS